MSLWGIYFVSKSIRGIRLPAICQNKSKLSFYDQTQSGYWDFDSFEKEIGHCYFSWRMVQFVGILDRYSLYGSLDVRIFHELSRLPLHLLILFLELMKIIPGQLRKMQFYFAFEIPSRILEKGIVVCSAWDTFRVTHLYSNINLIILILNIYNINNIFWDPNTLIITGIIRA